ncbi:MAG: alpha-mannosidase [Sedimentisphaeraceae bacterium JB056]
MKTTIAYIVSHAHWDREWRYPIWQTRKELEEMFSSLIELLEEEPRYKCFVTDSQVVMLEDYLDIRPEDEARIKNLVADGKLKIGPWYTLPEYYPIDGECIIRNLLKGDRACRRFGEPMKVGYTTFGWGQPSQLPQIYKNFGIDTVLGGKNLDSSRTKYNEFIWEGADGTKILASKLGGLGRANFFKCVVIPVVFGKENNGNDWKFDWDSSGMVFHRSDMDNYWQDYHRHFRDAEDSFNEERVKSGIDNSLKTVDGTAFPDSIILFDGGDFTAAQPMLCDIIDKANELYDDIEFKHSTLEEYIDSIKGKLDTKELSVVKGEWRDGPEPSTSANALAFRSDLKRVNRLVQRQLLHVAEPLERVASWIGCGSQQKYLDIAWDYLLKSHCHDSLHGVVQDKTARDTQYRVEQAGELADVVSDWSIKNIIRKINVKGKDDDIFLIIFNTLPFCRSGVVRAVVDTPQHWNAREIILTDPDGNRIDTELISLEPVKAAINETDCRPWPFHAHRHVIEFYADDVPSLGYKSFRVEVAETMDDGLASWPNPSKKGASLVNGPGILENEYLRLTLNSNGSFNLLYKETGKEYKNLNTFEDSGDAGCGWVRFSPSDDRVYTSLTSKVNSWISSDTPYAATLVTEVTMELPVDCDKRAAEFDLYASKRNNITKPVILHSEITLSKESGRVDIVTRFVNTVSNHRLRVLFPTELSNAEEFEVEKHFTVEKRAIEPNRDSQGRYMPGMNTIPQQNFVDVSDGVDGLAVINDGLCEFEVVPDDSRTIALTLLRSAKMRICTEPRVGAVFPTQNSWAGLGEYEFRYSLMPHSNECDLYVQSQDANIALMPIITNARKDGELPLEMSFAEIKGQLRLSCLKKVQDRDTDVLRLYNPESTAAAGEVIFNSPVKTAYVINMNEERVRELEINGNSIPVELSANEIMTIEFQLDAGA